MTKKRTSKEATFEILGGWLMNNNEVNVESLAHNIIVTADNTRQLYEERNNTRRKTRNLAICELMYWLDTELEYNGYRNHYATNKQVMDFDKEHGRSLERVLDLVEENIKEQRATI